MISDWLHDLGPERVRWLGLALGFAFYKAVAALSDRMEGKS